MVISHRGKQNYKLRQGAVKRFNTLGWGGAVSNLEFGICNLEFAIGQRVFLALTRTTEPMIKPAAS